MREDARSCQKKLPEEVAGRSCQKKLPEEVAGRSCRKKLPEEVVGRSCQKFYIFIAVIFDEYRVYFGFLALK